jgi:hypothetical protein
MESEMAMMVPMTYKYSRDDEISRLHKLLDIHQGMRLTSDREEAFRSTYALVRNQCTL